MPRTSPAREIEAAIEELTTSSYAMAEELYKNAQASSDGDGQQEPETADVGASSNGQADEGTIIDAETDDD